MGRDLAGKIGENLPIEVLLCFMVRKKYKYMEMLVGKIYP